MTPAARYKAIIEIFDAMEKAPFPMDGVVGDYMRHRRYIGSKDRAFVAESAYDIMRHHARLFWWLERIGLSVEQCDGRAQVIAWTYLSGRDAVKVFSSGGKYSPDPVSDEEAKLFAPLKGQDFEHKDMPDAVRVECPADWEEKLRGFFGEDFETEMAAMIPPATLDLRVNVFLSNRTKVQAALEKDGVKTAETPYSPWGLRCASKAFLSRTKAFSKGWVEIQDEGSQLIAHMCDVKPGMQVLDFCAGGGGKTLALAAAMYRKGRVVAMDNDSRRLEKGRLRYKKAQLSDIVEIRSLEEDKQRKWVKRQKGKFDVVLTDVPCSGTGTWRRNPDMRWRNYGPSLEELVQVQGEILQKASSCVKAGGRLVYATCSLLPDENEEQIAKFLEANPDFSALPVDEALGLGTPYMRLTPHRHNTDGFFAAVLVKSEDV